ncbi:MAG TPA: hypothetical protein VM187_18665 [Niastella sp.]|nr:hypothetical protein [Niastella sp.]
MAKKKLTPKTDTVTTTAPKPIVKGYKVFNEDFTCRGIKYEENKEFKHKGTIEICSRGLHFCLKAQDCFKYYEFDPKNIVCEVEALGDVQYHHEDSKGCTDHLLIGRRLTWQEVLQVANSGSNNTGHSNSGDSNSGDRNSGYRNSGSRNSGDRNSGYRNSGDSNSGYRNSGDRNSGSWNSGDRNSGDSNSGYRNSGAFCTDKNPMLVLFNKPTNITVKDWERHKAVELMAAIDPTIWVPANTMTDAEKEQHPKWETTDGYLKTIPIKEAWANAWNNWTDKNKHVFLTLPNFDAAIFEEITGIKITADDKPKAK